jgi:hypothetical protein
MKSNKRRTFIKKSIALSATVMGSSVLAGDLPKMKNEVLPRELTLLYQGDSITDAGRDRARYYPNDTWGGFGNGYSLMAAGQLMANNPNHQLEML